MKIQSFYSYTRSSYYNVTTRLVDLVGLCQLTQSLVDKNMLGQVLIVDLDYFFSWGLLVETKFISTNMLVDNDVRLGFDNSCSFLMC